MSAQVPPYMQSIKNVPAIFSRIKEAGTPPKFTHEFLKTSLGFTSSSDRNVVAVLKAMGFIMDDGTPTDRYNQYRGVESKVAIADGLREGWSDIFLADQKIHTKSQEQAREIFKSVTGKGETVAEKMASTFRALASLGDFNAEPSKPITSIEPETELEQSNTARRSTTNEGNTVSSGVGVLTLRHDVHVHLPSTSDVAVYKAIFRAIKDELAD